MRKYAMLVVAAVLLTACGGSNPNGPDPFPSPTPTPTPAPVVIKTVTFSNVRPGGRGLTGLTGIGPARLEGVVDWTNPQNAIWAVFVDASCLEAQGEYKESRVWDEGLCNLGLPVKGGSKPLTATATLAKEYKKNEEYVLLWLYAPTTNSGMESGTMVISQLP